MTPLETSLPPLRALAHPVRLRILAMITGKPVSATEVATATDLDEVSLDMGHTPPV